MTNCIERPPFAEWSAILNANVVKAKRIAEAIGIERVSSARTALIDEVNRFESELETIARSRNVQWKKTAIASARPIVMSGHQPVIYHPGLLQKLTALSAMGHEESLNRINVILDTDEAAAGEVIFPSRSSEGPRLAVCDIATGGPLLLNQTLRGADEIREKFADIMSRLDPSLEAGVGEKYRVAGQMYGSLAGVDVVHAQSIVMGSTIGRAYTEVPFSKMAQSSAIRALVVLPLRDLHSFVTAYNVTLNEHRATHKIENPANPFPNLSVEAEGQEVPLWLVDTGLGTRTKVFVKQTGESLRISAGRDINWNVELSHLDQFFAQLDSRYVFVPRGGWISALFRMFLSDMFIHGLGGEKYDEFTSAFIHRWIGVEAPQFVVTSATKYLFPEQMRRFNEAVELKSKFKDLISHTDSYLGRSLFGAEAEQKLAPMANRRKLLLEALKANGGSSEVKYELNALNKEIRKTIDESEIPTLIRIADTPESVVNAWSARVYPFFAF